jgi:hypothetical protein
MSSADVSESDNSSCLPENSVSTNINLLLPALNPTLYSESSYNTSPQLAFFANSHCYNHHNMTATSCNTPFKGRHKKMKMLKL